jgi:hypothetical protein
VVIGNTVHREHVPDVSIAIASFLWLV